MITSSSLQRERNKGIVIGGATLSTLLQPSPLTRSDLLQRKTVDPLICKRAQAAAFYSSREAAVNNTTFPISCIL